MNTNQYRATRLQTLLLSTELFLGFSACQAFAYDNPLGSSASNVTTPDAIITNEGSVTGALGITPTNPTSVEITNSGSIVVTSHGINTKADFGATPLITSLTNSGLIQSTGDIAIGPQFGSSSSIGTITNTATGQIIGKNFGIGSFDSDRNNPPIKGSINNIINSGLIQGTDVSGIFAVGPINNITNNFGATITGKAGIFLFEPNATTLINDGDIIGTAESAINLSDPLARIITLTNNGSIRSTGGYGINNSGIISTLNNGQGAGGNALTYTGALPTNYNIIINSTSSYGKLAVTNGSGSITFNVYAGSSVVNNHTYTAVLGGVGSSNLTSLIGTYNSFNWSLTPQAACTTNCTYDLVFGQSGPSLDDTRKSVTYSAADLRNAFALQKTVLAGGFTYDCSQFGTSGVCMSGGARYTMASSGDGINGGGGLLIAAYRTKNNFRFGAYVDDILSVRGGAAVRIDDSIPMFGLFGAWNERLDGSGTEIKVSAAFGQKIASVNRGVFDTSEPGSGSSQLKTWGAQLIAKHGFPFAGKAIVTPYAGLRYIENQMNSYSEVSSASVNNPLTYSELNASATTALVGVGIGYRVNPKIIFSASGGLDYDVNASTGRVSATNASIGSLAPVEFKSNSVRGRPTATASAVYDVGRNQRVSITGIYREEAFQTTATTSVVATYTVGLW